MDQPRKKVKVDDSRIFINLSNPQGEQVAQQLELSKTTTREELQQILNQLIRKDDNEEDMLFTFFHNTVELTETLAKLCEAIGSSSSEGTLDITYHPQSLFRIKPITR
jgi:NLE (NUC135) domain